MRRSLIAVVAAAACVAATVLSVPGPAAAATSYTLLTQPGSHTALYNLGAAAARGVSVKVILDGRHTSINGSAYSYLRSHGVGVVYSSSTYYYTHEKSMVVDGTTAVVMTENWTPTYYSADRNFDLIENDAADAAAMERVFAADYAKTSVTPGDGDDLVWSPTDAQARLLGLINGATRTLTLYSLEMGSTAIVNALVSAVNRGVTVKVVAEDDSSYASEYDTLSAAGASVVTYGSSDALYIHAKAIVADYGTGAAKVFLGSENFTSTSLNSNRELGLIIADPAVISSVNGTLATDFANGTPW